KGTRHILVETSYWEQHIRGYREAGEHAGERSGVAGPTGKDHERKPAMDITDRELRDDQHGGWRKECPIMAHGRSITQHYRYYMGRDMSEQGAGGELVTSTEIRAFGTAAGDAVFGKSAQTDGAAGHSANPKRKQSKASRQSIRTTAAMSTPHDIQLIEAVENGQSQRVRQLLAEGANPNSRKRVTLSRQIGFWERRTDTVECESVLALGILHAHEDVVKALLEGGADPNGVCEWKLANLWPSWAADDWDRERWLRTCLFLCALTLAVARGGEWTWWHGYTEDAPNPDNQLVISLKGGNVLLIDPKEAKDAFVEPFTLRPSLPIVCLLLSHGAVVTQRELDAARELPDTQFLQALQDPQSNPPTPVSSRPQPSSPPTTAPSSSSQPTEVLLTLLTDKDRENRELRAELDQVKRRNEELSVRTAKAESNAEELQRRNLVIEARNTTLEAGIQDLQTENHTLSAENRTLSTENRTLSTENRTLSTKNAALEREVGTLRTQLAPLPPSPPPREPQPPITVQRLMYAIADFEAQDTDELNITVGDAVFVNLEFADGWGSVSACCLSSPHRLSIISTALIINPHALPTVHLGTEHLYEYLGRVPYGLRQRHPRPHCPLSTPTQPTLLHTPLRHPP
ncbi:hypothetical protein HDU93_005522, partial [Gonapodya sp. JEL0774]